MRLPVYIARAIRLNFLTGCLFDHSVAAVREYLTQSHGPSQGSTSAEQFLREWRPCGRPILDFDKKNWQQCAGTFQFLRGLPCGIWLLFHTLSLGLAEHDGSIVPYPSTRASASATSATMAAAAAAETAMAEVAAAAAAEAAMAEATASLAGLQIGPASAREGMQAMSGYVLSFFQCRGCREHWQEMAKDIDTEVSDGKSAVLWLWRAHNKVTARTLAEQQDATNTTTAAGEGMGGGGDNPFRFDAAVPKRLWPADEQCPLGSSDLNSLKMVGVEAVCTGVTSDEAVVIAAMIAFYTEAPDQTIVSQVDDGEPAARGRYLL